MKIKNIISIILWVVILGCITTMIVIQEQYLAKPEVEDIEGEFIWGDPESQAIEKD